ncbi:nucleotide-binding domain-containing protein [Lophiotrema nucula]|uniref:Nucleotide-binding domain-containing protein n=1 Tax=Lophiotrema nucula TaxID=690887 RepID=A0A6A5YHD5_9PLEO|nr:nucleotide-binding domain-containing protein [Lophiotrema nucula]
MGLSAAPPRVQPLHLRFPQDINQQRRLAINSLTKSPTKSPVSVSSPRTNPKLTLWRDITPVPAPLKHPDAASPHILIIGAGVTGLVSAWVLLDKGYRVTVLSKDWVSDEPGKRLTSQIAGALWEFPPAVCGQHTDAISLQHSKSWCMTAYHIWDGIASHPALSKASGVKMTPSDFFFPCPVEQDPAQLSKMAEIVNASVRGFRRGAEIIKERGVSTQYGAVDAYELLAPIIDTDQAMHWLTSLVKSKGAKYISATIDTDLLDIEDSLRSTYKADVIVNCTGLSGTTLAGDESCYPIRGGLIRVLNDGTAFPKVEAALTITADAVHSSSEIIFLVPRNENILLIGGFAQPGEYALDLTLESEVVQRMRKRCNEFLPGLENAKLDESYPFAQGLRPFRQKNVRVERELRRERSRIVHSYGQGGAGWSLSFGCAQDVSTLVDEVLAGKPARAMGADFAKNEVGYEMDVMP